MEHLEDIAQVITTPSAPAIFNLVDMIVTISIVAISVLLTSSIIVMKKHKKKELE